MNRQEQKEFVISMADRRKSILGAVVGLVLLLAVHQLPGITLFGILPLQRVFFVGNFLACTMLVFGLAGVVTPRVFLNFSEHRRGDPVLSYKTIPMLAVAFFAVLSAVVSLVVYYVRA